MQGYSKGLDGTKICREGLQTDIANSLADTCLDSDPGDWFQDLQCNSQLTKEPGPKEACTEINQKPSLL